MYVCLNPIVVLLAVQTGYYSAESFGGEHVVQFNVVIPDEADTRRTVHRENPRWPLDMGV